MQNVQYPCHCGGTLEWKREKVVIDNVDCGVLDVEYCASCGEEYFPEESMETVEKKLKEKGLWKIRKEIRV